MVKDKKLRSTAIYRYMVVAKTRNETPDRYKGVNVNTIYRYLLEDNDLFHIFYGHGTASEKAKANRLWKKALNIVSINKSKNPMRSNPLTEFYIIFDAKYQKHGAVSKDYDKLQSIADRHNENAKGAHDIWHVGSVTDFNKTVKAIKETHSKRNTTTKTRATPKRPNYKAYTYDEAMRSLLTKLSKANFNGIHTGVSLAKITDEEKAAIKQFPAYFKVDRKAVYSKFPDEIEGGIALFSNKTKTPAIKRANKSEYGNDAIQKLSRTFQGKVSGTEFEVEAPEQQPERNSRLGELAKLTITKANGDEYEINFKGDAWLSADLRRNLWLSGEDSKITNIKLPPKDNLKLLGQAHFIHYLTEKKHIENNRMTEYFHEHGEVDGQRPYVYIDHEGFLHFHGGNYNIGRDGIEN